MSKNIFPESFKRYYISHIKARRCKGVGDKRKERNRTVLIGRDQQVIIVTDDILRSLMSKCVRVVFLG